MNDGDRGGSGFDDYDWLVKTKIENELSVMPPSASKGGVGEKLIKVSGSGRQYCFEGFFFIWREFFLSWGDFKSSSCPLNNA